MELTKGQYHLYKLHTVPDDASSAMYELSIPYFSTGLIEGWLQFRKALKRACAGQHTTTGPSVCTIAKRLLEGDALHAF